MSGCSQHSVRNCHSIVIVLPRASISWNPWGAVATAEAAGAAGAAGAAEAAGLPARTAVVAVARAAAVAAAGAARRAGLTRSGNWWEAPEAAEVAELTASGCVS